MSKLIGWSIVVALGCITLMGPVTAQERRPEASATVVPEDERARVAGLVASDAAIQRVMGGLLLIAILVTAVVWSIGRREAAADAPTDYERRRLYFAAVVLMGLGVTFFAAMAMYFFAGPHPARVEAGRKIFETCVSVIPPVVTLVLGYYFGRSESLRGDRQAQVAVPPNPAPRQPGDSSTRS